MPITAKPLKFKSLEVRPFLEAVESKKIPSSHTLYFDEENLRFHSRNRFYSFFVNISTRISIKIMPATDENSSDRLKRFKNKLRQHVIKNWSARAYLNLATGGSICNLSADNKLTAKELKKNIEQSGGLDKVQFGNFNKVTISRMEADIPGRRRFINSIEDQLSELINNEETTPKDVQKFIDEMSDSGKNALFTHRFRVGGFPIITWILRKAPPALNNIDSLKKLIEIGENINPDILNDKSTGENPNLYDTAFFTACEYGNIQIVELLLEKHAISPIKCTSVLQWYDSEKFFNGLMIACREGHLKIIKLLLAKEVIQTDEEKTKTFMFACQFAPQQAIELLINHYKPDILFHIDANGATAITYAFMSENNNIDILKLLFSKFPNQTKQALIKEDKNESTALMIACKNYNLEAVNLVLQQTSDLFLNYTKNKGAQSVNQPNNQSETSSNSSVEDTHLSDADTEICKQLSEVIDGKSSIDHIIDTYDFYRKNPRLVISPDTDKKIANIINCYGKYLSFSGEHINTLITKATYIRGLEETATALQRIKTDNAKVIALL